MDNITRIAKLKDDEYQALFEVQKPTFCHLHENSLTPYKKPKGDQLTLE